MIRLAKETKEKTLNLTRQIISNRKVRLWLIILMSPVLLITISIFAVWNYYSSELPSVSQLEKIAPKLVTNIYDKDNNISHEYYVERREWTPFDSIPAMAMNAVMATEDRKFYSHWGMNIWAIPSAISESVFKGAKLRGASTLSQQLSKLLFLTPERKISRKIKELNDSDSELKLLILKKKFLEFYMNEVYLWRW